MWLYMLCLESVIRRAAVIFEAANIPQNFTTKIR
jgi:hypothetical protein